VTREPMLERMAADRRDIERRMDEILPRASERPAALHEAMRYSSLAGGKRFRGILCLQAHRIFGDPHPGDALSAAAAIEFLHAYTLIHDDLPALDDDDTRRGMPSCHVRFGEAMALLAGDALQALAFETLSACSGANPEDVTLSVWMMAAAAGSRLLVGGQAEDMEGEGVEPVPGLVDFIHLRKTAELISVSLRIGAALASAEMEEIELIGEAGREAGLAFQIADDLLDLEGSEAKAGKGLRKDIKRGKITWPSSYGVDSSRETAVRLAVEAAEKARSLGDDGYLDFLFRLAADRAS
jgi:geranylgeranyl diphosphate synthase type II